jgi:mRNA-degrading endonuclease RelE of RelBE toxin-antitoxin system
MFEILFAEGAIGDLKRLPKNRRVTIFDAIERNLSAAPLVSSRSRKELTGLVPPWDQVRPVWQLRVGDYRVFYDADPASAVVIVQAIRHKARKTTGEIL